MPTTVTKTISADGTTNGSTPSDYSTLASWIAACPANLVTSDEIWDGQCYDRGKFTAGVTIAGITTDATRYVILECASGASFNAKSGVRTTALNYNSTTGSGVAVEASSNCVYVPGANYTVIDGLQIKATGYAASLPVVSTNCTVRNCIVTSTGAAGSVVTDVPSGIFENCLFIYTFAGGAGFAKAHGSYYNCTFICTAGSATAPAFNPEFIHQALAKNCAVFGFANFTSSNLSTSSDYNATDLGTASGGAHDQTSLTFSAQFTNSTNDWRATSQTAGTGLHNGTPDSTHAATDISLTSRDATNPYIGAWEATAPSVSYTVSPSTIPENHAGNITLTLVGTATSFNTGGSSVSVTNSDTGTTTVTKVTFTASDTTHATLTVTTGSGTGTFHLTVDTVDSPALTVATATLVVSPTSGLTSGTTGITLTGTHTFWNTDSPTFTYMSGPSGTSIGSISIVSDTSATATMTTGSSTGSGTLTDPSTTAACTFTVNAVTGTITITSPVQWQTYQRDGSDQADIPITGTYTGGPVTKDIEADFNGGGYATIDSSVSGGNFSGTLSAQAAGQGTLTCRFVNATGITGTVATVGIGDVFLVTGQSNAVGQLGNLQSYSNGSGLKATAYGSTDAYLGVHGPWQEGNDPFNSVAGGGSPWPLLATHHMADQGVPCAFVLGAIGGRPLTNDGGAAPWFWTKHRPDTGAAPAGYGDITAQVTASSVNAAKAALWYQGENDADGAVPQYVYEAALITFVDNIAADVAGAPKLVPMQFGGSSANTFNRPIALAISEAVRSGGNLIGMPTVYDVTNQLHLTSDGEGQTAADRFWAVLKSELFGGTSGNGHGPRVVSCQYNAARTTVTVCFDKVLKTGLTFSTSAWTVTGAGSGATVSAVAYHGTNTQALVLTLSSAASLPIVVSFADIDNPAGLTVPLGPNFTLPGGAGTINLPAEPFKGVTAAAASPSIHANLQVGI